MADAEQVSSTTPEPGAEERQPAGHVAPAAGLYQDNAHDQPAGLDVGHGQISSEAAAATGGPFTDPWRDEDEEVEDEEENKAETEKQEKLNLIPQPDSTHPEFSLLEDFTSQQQGSEELFLQESSMEVQEHMVSSYTEPEEDFGKEKVGEEEEKEEEEEQVPSSYEEDFLSNDIPKQMPSTTEIFNTFDLKEDPSPPEQEAAVSSVFAQPERSVPGEKEEQQWGTAVEEPFRPAPPASSSAYEPSLLSSDTAVTFPSVMQFSSVVELLYWRDVKNSGIVFGACLLLLLSLSVCSIISVLSYVALALLSVSISFRIYKGVLQAIQKSDEGHPFKAYLAEEVALPEDLVHKYTEAALGRINTAIVELRRLFLVEDLVDSLKFAVLMWILTYVGALFNGLTLLILGLVGAFTFPVIYEKHQVQIDHYITLVTTQVKDIVGKVQAKIPGAKKKDE